MFEFRLQFHWSLFPMVQLTIFQHWFRWWLGAVQATSHYLNQWWLVYRRIYASLGLNELTRYVITTSLGRSCNFLRSFLIRQAVHIPVNITSLWRIVLSIRARKTTIPTHLYCDVTNILKQIEKGDAHDIFVQKCPLNRSLTAHCVVWEIYVCVSCRDERLMRSLKWYFVNH